MANIIMPFGWNILEGNYQGAIVYQGTVARQYIDTPDPRSTAQMNNRYLWADIRKVMSSMGLKAKTCMRNNFGVKYMSNIYAYIRGDGLVSWESLVEEFNDLPDNFKYLYSELAPYKATWNNPGLIFYCVFFEIIAMLVDLGGYDWGMAAMGGEDVEDQVNWWLEGIDDALLPGLYDERYDLITHTGQIHYVAETGFAYNDGWSYIGEEGIALFQFVFYGRAIMLGYTGDTLQGNSAVYIDNEAVQYMRQQRLETQWRCQWVSDILPKGYHHVMVYASPECLTTLDFVAVYPSSSIRATPWIRSGHKYNYSAGWPFGIADDVFFTVSENNDTILGIGGAQDYGEEV